MKPLTARSLPDFIGFARSILADWPDVGDIDGFDLQDIAAKHDEPGSLRFMVFAACGTWDYDDEDPYRALRQAVDLAP